MITAAKKAPTACFFLEVAGIRRLFNILATSVSIAQALSGLDPSDQIDGDQDALAEYITEYLDEQDETPEGKPQ